MDRDKQPFCYLLLPVLVNGKRIDHALLDSAAPTCISWVQLQNINPDAKLLDEPVRLAQWAGNTLTTRGTARLQVQISEWVVDDALVIVVDKSPTPFVIGGDLLQRAGNHSTDYAASTVQFGNYAPIPFYTPTTRFTKYKATAGALEPGPEVTILRRFELAPWTGMYVPVLQRGRESPSMFSADLEFVPDEDYQRIHHTVMRGGLAGDGATSYVWAENLSDDTATFHRKSVV